MNSNAFLTSGSRKYGAGASGASGVFELFAVCGLRYWCWCGSYSVSRGGHFWFFRNWAWAWSRSRPWSVVVVVVLIVVVVLLVVVVLVRRGLGRCRGLGGRGLVLDLGRGRGFWSRSLPGLEQRPATAATGRPPATWSPPGPEGGGARARGGGVGVVGVFPPPPRHSAWPFHHIRPPQHPRSCCLTTTSPSGLFRPFPHSLVPPPLLLSCAPLCCPRTG
jgi:hypothetical protein